MEKQTDYGVLREGQSISREVTRKNKKNADVPAYGLYRHKVNGETAIVQGDPLWGNAQAQAFIQTGYEFVRDIQPGEVKTLPELQAEQRSADADSLKGLLARVNALEGTAEENAQLKRDLEEAKKRADEAEAYAKELEETKKSAPHGAMEKSAEGAKENAVEQTKAREEEKEAKGNAAGTTSVANAKAQKEGK